MIRTREQELEYRDAVVTFIDILGFRDLVANRTAQEILSSIGLLRAFGGTEDSNQLEPFETQSFAFSDSVVRVRYFDFQDGEGQGAIFSETLNLVHAQAELVNRGILVRGGLTTGRIFAAPSNVFGPAFVRAYELESSFANFPRIVLGPEVFSALRNDVRLSDDVAHDVHYLRRLLRKGDDGLWFIDYLKAIRRELDEPELYPDLLSEHRRMILQNAAAASSLRTLQKYLWLSTYHNSVVQEAGDSPEYLIDKEDLSALELLNDIAHGINPDFD